MDAVSRAGVPVVLGHRWPLTDTSSAEKFTETFFESLLRREAPEQALLKARQALPEQDPTWASAVMIVQES